ncbi:MAG TPA: FIST N-terminal domain-containing protein, partial [Arenibaculum sp.]|nr:FIST N-terminal domain-containing protein [Arenibaculum sp.]
MVDVASSRHTDSREAGRLLAARLRPGLSDAAWILAFCGGKHDPSAFLRGLRDGVGSIPVVGGSAPGVIT